MVFSRFTPQPKRKTIPTKVKIKSAPLWIIVKAGARFVPNPIEPKANVWATSCDPKFAGIGINKENR